MRPQLAAAEVIRHHNDHNAVSCNKGQLVNTKYPWQRLSGLKKFNDFYFVCDELFRVLSLQLIVISMQHELSFASLMEKVDKGQNRSKII